MPSTALLTVAAQQPAPWIPVEHAWMLGPILGGGVGGILMGCIGGGFCSILVAKGIARTFVVGYFNFLIILGLAMLAVGIAAIINKQPYAIWYSFTLCGALATCISGTLSFIMRHQYRAVEQRKLDAQLIRAA